MKSIVLVLSIFLFSIFNYGNDKIYYSLHENVCKEIKIGMKKIREHYKEKKADSEFYVSLSKSKTNPKQASITLNIVQENNYILKELKENTNRYLIVSKKIKLPVIVDYDFEYSTIFDMDDGGRLYYSNNGYYLIFNTKGEVLGKGFSQ